MGTLICMAGILLLFLPLPLDNPPTVSVPSAVPGPASSSSQEVHQQQDPSKSGFTIKSNTDLVTVDAFVRTNKGGFVGNLQPEDFAVYDNGVAQDITLFSREQIPLAVALVVDRSPSVQPYLAQLRSAALAALERLKPEDQVALFSFDMNPAQFSELTKDRQRIAQMVSRIPSGIGTNIYDALFDAASYLYLKAPDWRRAIILISDNYQTSAEVHSDRETLQEMLEAAVILYSIKTLGDNQGFSGLGSPDKIARIAKETGGEVLNADTVNKFVKALDAALLNLKEGYVLGFTPSNLGQEGSYHRLDVKLNTAERCPKCQVQARTGYYAGVQPPPTAQGLPWGSPKPSVAGMNQPARVPSMSRPVGPEELIAQTLISAAQSWWADLEDILFDVSTAEVRDAKGKRQVIVDLQIDAANVLFKIVGDRHVGRLRITTFYMDSKGKSLAADWKIMDLRLTEGTYQRMMQSGISYSTTIPLKTPGRWIKVVVYDPGSDRLGSRLVQMK